MKRLIKFAVPALLLVLALALSSYGTTGGTPPVVSYGDVDITVGESLVQDMAAAGYDINVFQETGIDGSLPGRTWLQQFLVAKKEKSTCAYLYIYNPSATESSLSSCTVYKMKIGFPAGTENSYWADSTTVNGINFVGLDMAGVKEAMGEMKLKSETEGFSLRYADGAYSYLFYFDSESGQVKEVLIEREISKSYS